MAQGIEGDLSRRYGKQIEKLWSAAWDQRNAEVIASEGRTCSGACRGSGGEGRSWRR